MTSCLKCGASALPGTEFCFAHAETEDRGLHADVPSWLSDDWSPVETRLV